MKLTYKEMQDALEATGTPAIHESLTTFHCKQGNGNDRLYVTNVGDALLFYCHHCGCGGAIKNKRATYKRYVQGDSIVAPTPTAYLPPDITDVRSKWPTSGYVWLLEAGIDEKGMTALQVRYSPSLNRMIIPLFANGKYNGWIGRKCGDGPGPKYLTKLIDKKYNTQILRANPGKSLVLVEDILSAYRVFNLGYNTVALLGVGMTEPSFIDITSKYNDFVIWLDNDKPEVKKAQVKLATRLGMFGNAKIVKTDCDPKEHSDTEIREILK